MNREGHENADFFIGYEVERTPAYGMRTLFVDGVQHTETILNAFIENKCEHIFFGANHSFTPIDEHEWQSWERMIEFFLKDDILCSLDIPITLAEEFLETAMVEYNNFIPQLRVPVPYIKQWNYNTMIKLDDKDFKATNPGVWCHSLHDLMARDKFTDWTEYQDDNVL